MVNEFVHLQLKNLFIQLCDLTAGQDGIRAVVFHYPHDIRQRHARIFQLRGSRSALVLFARVKPVPALTCRIRLKQTDFIVINQGLPRQIKLLGKLVTV